MEIAEIRKLKVELETDILVLLRDFTTKTKTKIEGIELTKMIQERIGREDYCEVISVGVKTTL